MLHNLNVYDNFNAKCRLGNLWDGGYVVSILSIGASEAVFSYGVGGDISFERDYCLLTGKKAYCFDHTIENIGIPEDLKDKIAFKKEGISGEDKADTKHFFTHYEAEKINGRVLLKLDVEGCEYEFFEKTDLKKLASITSGIVIEFHNFHIKETYEKFLELLGKINNFFYIIHIHGNNYGGKEQYYHNGQPYIMPHFLEVSFISKEISPIAKISDGPHPDPRFDCKNELSKEEHNLDFLKLIK
jgi:hypothetical protein